MENYQLKGAIGMIVLLVCTALMASGFFDLGAAFYVDLEACYLMQIAMMVKFLGAGLVYVTWKNYE